MPASARHTRLQRPPTRSELADFIREREGIEIDRDAIFDIQIKRIHEYKRQHLNILETIAHWQAIRENPDADWTPRVKIFGGKAAPGYVFAKRIIHLINDVARAVNADPVTNRFLKVVYLQNYNVSLAERLIPAADLSEQISTAGKEASGTGNMKFALNGALTIGTLDGANVEIRDLVGADNFFLFGMTAPEVVARRAVDGHAGLAIEASPELAGAIDAVGDGTFSPEDPDRYRDIVENLRGPDYFLVCSDFAAYYDKQREVDAAYRDRDRGPAWRR
jgi:starch phosphorylase